MKYQNKYGMTREEEIDTIKGGLKIWALLIVLGFMTVYNMHKLIFILPTAHAEAPQFDPVANFKLPDGPIIIKEGIDPPVGKIKTPRLSDVSAYTSRIQETDDTPCIAANGKDICKLHKQGVQTCASNDYKLGTTLKIDGMGTCIIMDRMNRRYSGTGRVDWYMGMDTASAYRHGVKKLLVTEL